MNKLSKQQYTNKNSNVEKFFAKYQLYISKDGVFPKFINSFEGKHKELWSKTFDRLLPKNNLGFNNENDYLKDNKITKNDVIINSIMYCLPDIKKEDVNYLLSYFLVFSKKNKIKVLTIDKELIPVYFEIINTLDYIKKIQEIINKYPKNNGNHHGTKHRSSSYKKLLETQSNILENRLNGLFFPVENEDEKEKLRIQIKFIKYSLIDEYKNLPEWMNFIYTYVGFDTPYFEMSKKPIYNL